MIEPHKVTQLTEGPSKGGQNPPNESDERPPAPGGSGGTVTKDNKKCAFCGRGTDFMNYGDYLCLPCGDGIQGYDTKALMELASRFAECVTRYKAVSSALGKAEVALLKVRDYGSGNIVEDVQFALDAIKKTKE